MKPIYNLLLIVLSLISSILILKFNFSKVTDLSTFALGTKTATYYAKDKNKNLIHISAIDNIGENTLLNSWTQDGKKNVILILGNSQTHSINQIKEKEVNYVELLDKNIFNYKIFANSFANASLQDFLISYSYWKKILPIKILVIPVFLDDMRETNGISYNFFPNLVKNRVQFVNNGNLILEKINSNLSSSYDNELKMKNSSKKLQLSTQDIVEKKFNLFFENNFDFWNNRKNAHGIILTKLYELRNTIFNIKATTVRPMMPAKYEDNISALNLIIKDASRNGIKIFIYVPPIRNDVIIPYIPNEYLKLKYELRSIASNPKNNVYFKDFDNIIPAKYYGFKESTTLGGQSQEIDFMHFQFKGHRILSDSLFIISSK